MIRTTVTLCAVLATCSFAFIPHQLNNRRFQYSEFKTLCATANPWDEVVESFTKIFNVGPSKAIPSNSVEKVDTIVVGSGISGE